MTYKLTHVRLLVENMPAMMHFYRDVLGFTSDQPEDAIYNEVRAGDIQIAFFVRDEMAEVLGTASTPQHASDNPVLCFAVEDVDTTCRQLAAQGVQIIVPPIDRPVWGLRTAHLRDPEGNLIEINHNLPNVNA